MLTADEAIRIAEKATVYKNIKNREAALSVLEYFDREISTAAFAGLFEIHLYEDDRAIVLMNNLVIEAKTIVITKLQEHGFKVIDRLDLDEGFKITWKITDQKFHQS